MLALQQGQQQASQQPNQQQPQNAPQGQGQQIPPPPPQNGQDYNLSNVLHFLQTEWRRYERDRNEWEIERAEMRARIALLEGERRSFDNVKLDLMRRIKMLEYALRMERSKQLSLPAASQSTSSLLPAKLPIVQSLAQKEEHSSTHREDSRGSSPHSEESPLPDARIPNGITSEKSMGRQNSWGPQNWAATLPPTGISKAPPGRDPKSRARSRDYLKQCLQEITYLTSPQAMNPLPNRPLVANLGTPAPGQPNASNPNSLPLTLPNLPAFDQMGSGAYNGRPRKVLPEGTKEFPTTVNGVNALGGPASSQPIPASHSQQQPSLDRPTNPTSTNPQATPPPSISPPSINDATAIEEKETADEEPRQLTAIFRPDDAGEWKEKLRIAHEASLAAGGSASGWDKGGDDDLKDDDEVEEDVLDDQAESEDGAKAWKAKRTLRNHLDAVRALAFHPTELCLATGGDDCTVKIWRMDVPSLASSATRPTTEVEPQLTLRGHSAPITRLIHSSSKNILYSASLDSSIRAWAIPPLSHSTYAPYDESLHRDELIGHTDAVWDLALARDESTLISCGAEGKVKVWDVNTPSGRGSLKLTWGYHGLDLENAEATGDLHDDPMAREDGESGAPGATAVEAIKSDLKKIAVAYQNAVVKIFEIETGKEVMKLGSDVSYDGTPATQVNRVVSHPTMSLLITAHEDKYIRIFDITTGECTHSMLAHLDGVTSLSIDASGFSLVSGSHDCSIRFWDLMVSHACVQEMTVHREKAREGVLDVEFHPSLPFMASAGADGVVKLYASS